MGIFVFGVLRVYANNFKNTKYAMQGDTKVNRLNEIFVF